jgi:hypothetical protein
MSRVVVGATRPSPRRQHMKTTTLAPKQAAAVSHLPGRPADLLPADDADHFPVLDRDQIDRDIVGGAKAFKELLQNASLDWHHWSSTILGLRGLRSLALAPLGCISKIKVTACYFDPAETGESVMNRHDRNVLGALKGCLFHHWARRWGLERGL